MAPASPAVMASRPDPGELQAFLRGLRTHHAVLCAHAFLLRRGLLLGHRTTAGILLSAATSTSTSRPAHAHLLLHHLPPPLPLFSLDNALRALAPRLPFPALLSLFAALLRSHHPAFPARFSFPTLLSKASSSSSPRLHLPSALALHAQLLRRGLLFSPPLHAANALLHFYAAATLLPCARNLFDEMPFRDVASYNTMMTAYAGAVDGIDAARHLFDGMLLRNVVSWNIMINGYVKVKRPKQALEVVRWMAEIGVRGTAVAMVGAATACARLGRLGAGKEVHCAYLRRFEECNLLFSTALVDMYGKCRNVDAARKVFDRLSFRNIVCWNAMIIGHCVYGEPGDGIRLFHDMIGQDDQHGLLPDEVTFIGVLCACTRLALLDDGKAYFEQMSTMYNIKPTFAHYWCMANLYASVGLLEEAEGLLTSMPEELKAHALGGLLGLCRFRGEWELGERIVLRLIELEPSNSVHYALLCNVYASAGKWEDVHRVKAIIKERDEKLSPGHRLVNLNEILHQFRERQPENQEIYGILDSLVSRLKLRSRRRSSSSIVIAGHLLVLSSPLFLPPPSDPQVPLCYPAPRAVTVEASAAAAAVVVGRQLMEVATPNNNAHQVIDELVSNDDDDDRLSALPDEILIDILQRLLLRTAAQTTILARRWTHLFPSMTHLKIDINEFVPHLLTRHNVARSMAMSRYTQALRTLLAPTIDPDRTIRTMHLRFYPTDAYLLSIARMVDDAVQSASASKIEVLDFAILNEVSEVHCTEKQMSRYGRRFMSFFQACPNGFRCLTSLSLWALRFRDSDIPNLLGSCYQLQHLLLGACNSGRNSVLKIDASPCSQLRTLRMIFCSYIKVELVHVPKLESVDCDTWVGVNPPVYFGCVPLLDKIRFSSTCLKMQQPFVLSSWLSTVPTLTSLHLDFQYEMVWIMPEEPKKLFPIFRNLKDVYLYNISHDSGLDWTLFVLEGAPSLKSFHVKISHHICGGDGFEYNAGRSNVVWEASSDSIKHKNLRLLDITGFETEENLIKYIRLAIQRAIALQRIHLHEKEPCEDCDDIYLNTPSLSRTRFPNNEQEKDLLREQLLQGFSSSIEIIIECKQYCQVVDDRLSALPDEILIDILQRLQLPTAARTTTLARRWTHLLQSMNHLEIDVADFIPRRSAPSLKRNTMARVKVAMSRYTQAMRTLLSPRAESPQLIIIRMLLPH
uniref:F-box domain-containing protein n=1 Tax=Oryza meridionalis TaxID=40149 RepID=A0A0E0DKX2_9ORYZ